MRQRIPLFLLTSLSNKCQRLSADGRGPLLHRPALGDIICRPGLVGGLGIWLLAVEEVNCALVHLRAQRGNRSATMCREFF